MKFNNEWRTRLAQILLGAAIVFALVVVRGTHAGNDPVHLATDWSHHHMVFSAPHNFGERIRLLSNPRYAQQLVRRGGEGGGIDNSFGDPFRWRRAPETPETLNRDWSEDMGSGATVGAGNYPAKYSFNSGTANCATPAPPAGQSPDYVLYNTGLAGVTGAGGQATIIAFDNLYTGCTNTVPSTYWAYNTGTGDSVVTSPTLSGDGKQVAFIQSVSGGAASLVLLRWAAGSGTIASPVAPTAESAANYYNGGTGCTAPCMIAIAFGDGDSDTTSAPFYDFSQGSDTLYVGDATGKLHKFHPVFKGAPAEVTTGGFPFTMATAPLSSPIYDEGSGLVFASAGFSTTNNGGRLHALCATVAVPSCGTVGTTTVASGLLGPSTAGMTCQTPGAGATSGSGSNLYFDTPVVDPVNQTVYVVIGNDSTGSSAIYEFPEAYTANSCGTELKLGTGSTTGIPVYAGNFDNLYYCNGTAACTSGGAGHYYVCANTGGDPTLYQVTVSSAGIISGTPNASTALTTTSPVTCGPVTEVYNPNAGPATDWIFTSVEASAKTTTPISCPANSGCIMSFNVTSGAALTTTTATVGHTTVAGGTSGVIADNTVESSPTGGSQVYFTPLTNQTCQTSTGTGGCAIQASQSLLGE